ncbi:MAG: very short patch repair endonuclease [Methylotenera sp.]|nr:very short patch repair endonuclease [Methylotenera sp.]
MVDTLTAEERSRRMTLVRSKNTKPEILVRKILWGMGFRYRLHAKDLPGKPDIVFRKKKKVILIHGCFWHMHEDCRLWRLPKSRQEFWEAKLLRNKDRDTYNQSLLHELGWEILVIWECELKNTPTVTTKIATFLNS